MVLNKVSQYDELLERQEKIQDKKKSNDRAFVLNFYCLLMPHEGITGKQVLHLSMCWRMTAISLFSELMFASKAIKQEQFFVKNSLSGMRGLLTFEVILVAL